MARLRWWDCCTREQSPLELTWTDFRIILICAEQARRILDNIGNVFRVRSLLSLLDYAMHTADSSACLLSVRNVADGCRVFVPMITYFIIMWAGTFIVLYYFSRRVQSASKEERYQSAVVQVSHPRYGELSSTQSFTAGSNK